MREAMRVLLRPISSLRLTVLLLALSMFLVFAGTWAQIDLGIWTTLHTYFRSFLVWIPLQIFLPRAWDVPGFLPFPGGFTVGGLLMINLLAAHALRFRWRRNRIGLLLAHFGLVLLIVGELVTALTADEAQMSIDEGQTVNFAEDTREIELAIIDPQDPQGDRVISIPQSLLQKPGLIQNAALPFEVQVDRFYANASIVESNADERQGPLVDRGTALTYGLRAVERPVASGVDQDRTNLPTAFISVFEGGSRLGTWMVSLYFTLIPEPRIEEVRVGDHVYYMALRFKRTYKPYSVQLVDFRHDRYLGTDTPRNYSSQIRLIDAEHGEDRLALVYMNHPLRYRGETFYQASYKLGDTGTILQVVRNPGWLLPYIACTFGAFGLLLHFGISLMRFLRQRKWGRSGHPSRRPASEIPAWGSRTAARALRRDPRDDPFRRT